MTGGDIAALIFFAPIGILWWAAVLKFVWEVLKS